MNPSHDIKALFERFGGDASIYREICMENEAREARGRWPLLGLLDPRHVEVPATDAERDDTLESGLAARGAHSGPDDSQAVMRRSAPLFTRSPRRDVPPAIPKEKPVVPESGMFRFSPVPAAGREGADMAHASDADAAVMQAGPFKAAPASALLDVPALARGEASTPDRAAVPRQSPAAPHFAESGTTAGGSTASACEPLFMRLRAGRRGDHGASEAFSRNSPGGVVAPLVAPLRVKAPEAKAAQCTAPGAMPSDSPLKRLCAVAARTGTVSHLAAPPARTPEAAGHLDDLFDRLRGGNAIRQPYGEEAAGGNAESSRRPWFLREAGSGAVKGTTRS